MYGFRVSAYNIHGWGQASTPAYLKAAQKPSQIPSVTTSIDASTGNLVISWTTPNNNGDTIFAYHIGVQNKVTSAWSNPATCVGTSPTVLS